MSFPHSVSRQPCQKGARIDRATSKHLAVYNYLSRYEPTTDRSKQTQQIDVRQSWNTQRIGLHTWFTQTERNRRVRHRSTHSPHPYTRGRIYRVKRCCFFFWSPCNDLCGGWSEWPQQWAAEIVQNCIAEDDCSDFRIRKFQVKTGNFRYCFVLPYCFCSLWVKLNKI